MARLRQMGCVRIYLATILFAIGTTVAGNAWAQPGKAPPAKPANNDYPNDSYPSSSYQSGNSSAQDKQGEDRFKLLQSIKETLETFKPPQAQKADDDLFVIGTIDLKNKHATVDFVIKEGVQPSADFIADFVLGKPSGAIREWRVFGRAKTKKVADGMLSVAKAQSVEGQLSVFKLSTPGKKSPDDYFVIGTADMNCTTLHADIRFEILPGVSNASDFLIDFIFNKPKDHKGEWHVFYRAPNEALATDYRQQMRDWYDNLEAQRAQLAAIYKAKTTARC